MRGAFGVRLDVDGGGGMRNVFVRTHNTTESRYVSFCRRAAVGCSGAAPSYSAAVVMRRKSLQAKALECGVKTGTGGRTLNHGVALPGRTT